MDSVARVPISAKQEFSTQDALDERDVFLDSPQASESKSTGFRVAVPKTAPPKNTAVRKVAG